MDKVIRRASDGFTLVEMLVAITLLSFVFLILANSLQFASSFWRANDAELRMTSRVGSAEHLLRQLLSEAVPVTAEATLDSRRHVYFAGDRSSIQFVAPMMEHLSAGGFYEVSLSIKASGGAEKELELTWRPYPDGTQMRKSALLKGDVDVSFSYFGAQRADRNEAWHETWQDQSRLPRLVSVQIRLDRKNWPTVLIAPRVQSVYLVPPNPELF